MKKVTNILELMAALNGSECETIELQNSIVSPITLTLPRGVKLVGAQNTTTFLSFNNSDGIALSGDNEISFLAIQTTPDNRAIYIQSIETDLGMIKLTNLTITGQIQLLTRESTMKTNILVEDVDIIASDSRKYSEQPQKYGVNVYQGALTIYNYNSNPDSQILANVKNISLGRKEAPVIGSGIFIGGFNDVGGTVMVEKLVTNDIYVNGMIPSGQPNLITGAVFILNGAKVKEIHTTGSVTTYGSNDMVLDVWGEVIDWEVTGPIVSYGSSGIGFVNFGTVGTFVTKEKIETFGLGARGFNQYDGTIKEAVFDSITTHGPGSIGIQISKPVGTITVVNTIETNGSIGNSLVKGIIMPLAADAVSIKEGGHVEKLKIGKNIVTNGDNVTCYHVDAGVVEEFQLGGEMVHRGENSKPVFIENNGKSPIPN